MLGINYAWLLMENKMKIELMQYFRFNLHISTVSGRRAWCKTSAKKIYYRERMNEHLCLITKDDDLIAAGKFAK